MQVFFAQAVPTDWVDPIFSAAQMQNFLTQQGYVLLQIADGGHLLGLALAETPADILSLYVPEPLRRQGRAEALFQAFFSYAKALGVTGLTLEVRADNTAAITLYTKLGFNALQRRVGYYGGMDALVLGVKFT